MTAASEIGSSFVLSTTPVVDSETGDLELNLSNGDRLRIYKEPEYESYRLRIGG